MTLEEAQKKLQNRRKLMDNLAFGYDEHDVERLLEAKEVLVRAEYANRMSRLVIDFRSDFRSDNKRIYYAVFDINQDKTEFLGVPVGFLKENIDSVQITIQTLEDKPLITENEDDK